ncbi:MAG: hypothetical protein H6832_09305 [Planctomycetes bacterium]|nr:hypothetical protein [Planctomycetota bacterium]
MDNRVQEIIEALCRAAALQLRHFDTKIDLYVRKGRGIQNERRQSAKSFGVEQALDVARLQEFAAFRSVIESDSVFQDGLRLAGAWGSANQLAHHLLAVGATVLRGRLRFDAQRVVDEFSRLRRMFTAKSFAWDVSVRITGLQMTIPAFEFDDGVSLRRLSMKEINSRMPAMNEFEYGDMKSLSIMALAHGRLSVRCEERFDSSESNPVLAAWQRAHEAARAPIDRVVDALRLALTGSIGRSQPEIEVLSGGGHALIGHSVEPRGHAMILRKSGCERLTAAYDYVCERRDQDEILRAAVRSYLDARGRAAVEDRVLFYAAAWEAIVQVTNGKWSPLETAFRFATHGAALLRRCGYPSVDTYEKLRHAYDARSSIAHGNEKGLQRLVKGSRFASLDDICAFLECSFRDAFFYLLDLDAGDRPYKSKAGWPCLIFS